MPASYADNGDFILMPGNTRDTHELPFFDKTIAKGIKAIAASQIPEIIGEIREVMPWGWDSAVRKSLLDAGIPETLLPTEEEISQIRRLSHRRLTIPFREFMAEKLNETLVKPAKEIFSTEEAEQFLSLNQEVFFKAPWSSSGRGITLSSHISSKGLMEWIHGVVRRQGSVIAEPAWNKTLDFASEWKIQNGKAEFLGVAVFKASRRGKYHGNINETQKSLLKLIEEATDVFSQSLIEAQKEALQLFIAPYYSGPLGIDMLADSNRKTNTCVEINLRMTMGHIPIKENLTNFDS